MGTSESSSSSGVGQYVRTELLGTVVAILVLVGGYGYLFLDDHLEWGAEYVLGRSFGAEVNIGDLRTGWVRPGLTIRNLRVTNPENPDRNTVELGTLSVELSLDALLRMKYVVNDASLEGLRTDTRRSTPGWVQEEGGDLRWLYEMLLETVKSRLEESSTGTVFGDVGALLGGGSTDSLIQEQSENLKARQRLVEARSRLGKTESDLGKTMERLPTSDDYNRLEKRVKSIGESSGAVSEKIKTLRRLRETLKDWESTLNSARDHVKNSLNDLDSSIDGIKTSVNDDAAMLRRRIQLPALNFEDPSTEIFKAFVGERASTVRTILGYYRQYVATESSGGAAADTTPPTADSTPEATVGRDYAFQTNWSYPDFWLKEFRLSGSGNDSNSLGFFARIRNISSYPPVVGGQSGVVFNVTNPSEDLDRIEGNVSRTRRNGQPLLRYQLTMTGLSIEPWQLFSGGSIGLRLKRGDLLVDFSGNFRGNTHTSRVSARVEEPVFEVSGSSGLLKKAVEESVSSLGHLELTANGKGEPGSMDWAIKSNLGSALKAGVQQVVSDRIGEIKDELVNDYRGRIQEERKKLTQSVDELRSKFEGRLRERSNRLDSLENKVQKRIEEATKKQGTDSLKKLFD